jgi:Flp pilus assembly protein TadB
MEKPDKKIITASVSDVGQSLSKDQSSRAKRYFISMMVRTLCFILAVITPSPFRWIALLGAVLLPYVAVVVANAGREIIRDKSTIYTNKQKQIGS